jgi:hypothetical protein
MRARAQVCKQLANLRIRQQQKAAEAERHEALAVRYERWLGALGEEASLAALKTQLASEALTLADMFAHGDGPAPPFLADAEKREARSSMVLGAEAGVARARWRKDRAEKRAQQAVKAARSGDEAAYAQRQLEATRKLHSGSVAGAARQLAKVRAQQGGVAARRLGNKRAVDSARVWRAQSVAAAEGAMLAARNREEAKAVLKARKRTGREHATTRSWTLNRRVIGAAAHRLASQEVFSRQSAERMAHKRWAKSGSMHVVEPPAFLGKAKDSPKGAKERSAKAPAAQ